MLARGYGGGALPQSLEQAAGPRRAAVLRLQRCFWPRSKPDGGLLGADSGAAVSEPGELSGSDRKSNTTDRP